MLDANTPGSFTNNQEKLHFKTICNCVPKQQTNDLKK